MGGEDIARWAPRLCSGPWVSHPGRTPNGSVPENQERGEEENKKEKPRADGMYENERKRARVGTPELIVAEEHRAAQQDVPYPTRDWLLFAGCCAVVNGTARLAKGMLALASFSS